MAWRASSSERRSSGGGRSARPRSVPRFFWSASCASLADWSGAGRLRLRAHAYHMNIVIVGPRDLSGDELSLELKCAGHLRAAKWPGARGKTWQARTLGAM